MEQAMVFIVRLWGAVEARAPFRAAVLRAGTDESAWFTQPDALATYFEQQVGAQRARDPADKQDGAGRS